MGSGCSNERCQSPARAEDWLTNLPPEQQRSAQEPTPPVSNDNNAAHDDSVTDSKGSVTFAEHCLVLWDDSESSQQGSSSAPSSVSSNPLVALHAERRCVVAPGVPHRMQRGRPLTDLAL